MSKLKKEIIKLCLYFFFRLSKICAGFKKQEETRWREISVVKEKKKEY